jgi:Mg-chelatase subunit ChlD
VHGLLGELAAALELREYEKIVTLLYRIPHSLNDVINEEFFDGLLTAVKTLQPGILQVKLLAMLQDRADPRKKAGIRRLLLRKILFLSRKIAARASHMSRTVVTHYRPGLDEIDVDRTLEEQIGHRSIDYENIYCHRKMERKNAYVLMLDVSNSMHQEKIAVGAIATGVFASKLKNDAHGVLTFARESSVVKHVDEPNDLELLVDRMLGIRSGGATDIRSALLKGLGLIGEAKTALRTGILVTDGWSTVGGDPVEVATRYDRLHVLGISFGLGGSDPAANRLMAEKGRGRYRYVGSYEDLPAAITRILTDR